MKCFFLIVICWLLVSSACQSERKEGPVTHFYFLDSIIRNIESELLPLEREIEALSGYSADLFEKSDSLVPLVDPAKYIMNDSGFFYNPNPDNDESTVFVSFASTDLEKSINEVYITELMDTEFKEIINKYPMVSQVYYNSANQFSRLYPPYDLLNTLDLKVDVTGFNFYYLADEVRNPSKKSVWVEEVYIDPVGRGWILSLIHPVYHNEELRGVLGMDITLTDFMSIFLDRYDKKMLIIDSQGTIVAGNVGAIEALSMPPLKNHTYIQTIISDNFRKEDFNLFKSKSKEVRRMASKFLLEKENFWEFEMTGKRHEVYCRQMNMLDWYLLDIHD
ncbi:cache domain-containing protein [Negadavirga shengliensis]|uniref:Cache domain-containing protein n=1 Tax=Negadavirga shengliensis TaxID=1389218 RepID=A0ABV9T378_9BACT